MNKYISTLLFLIYHLSINAQDITNTLGENGNFRVKGNTGSDIQFKIEHDGNVGIHVADGLELTSSINIGGSFATTIRDVYENHLHSLTLII